MTLYVELWKSSKSGHCNQLMNVFQNGSTDIMQFVTMTK